MVHVVVALRDGGYRIDSGFTVYDALPEPDGGWQFGDETVRVVKNPVRVLEQLWATDWVKVVAREVWCEHWVLDCGTGKIVLDNDWTERRIKVSMLRNSCVDCGDANLSEFADPNLKDTCTFCTDSYGE